MNLGHSLMNIHTVLECYLYAFDAEFLKHILCWSLIGVYHDPLWVKHEYIHREPFGRHPERV